MLLDALTQDSTKRRSRLGWESVDGAGGCRVQAADCSTAASHRARQSAAAPPIPALTPIGIATYT